MSNHAKALIWATVIIAAALLAKNYGASDAASFGLIAGLTGAAWGSINQGKKCDRGCA